LLVGLDGKIKKQLTADGKDGVYNGSAFFSPDGKTVAFYADHDSRSDLVVVEIASGKRTVVLAQGKNWYPRFSPDGKFLLYTAPADGQNEKDLDLFAVPVAGGAPLLIAGGKGNDQEGRWSARVKN
jgi:Tol biopolymer transport system component